MSATRGPALPRHVRPSVEQCTFGPWTVSASKSHILASEGPDRLRFEESLKLPHLPEMIFDKNILRIEHQAGFGIQFSALDALSEVDSEHDTMKVAHAKEWSQARSDCEHISNVVNPFDWTFTTEYRGTLISSSPQTQLKVEDTSEKVDTVKLLAREKIHFYSDLLLFEDELHDNGCSIINVKIRVMPTFFFVLMRQYMRVDDVLIRINDTRVYHEMGKDYILREFTARESKYSDIKAPTHLLTDPNEIWDKIAVKKELFERLSFPDSCESVPQTVCPENTTKDQNELEER